MTRAVETSIHATSPEFINGFIKGSFLDRFNRNRIACRDKSRQSGCRSWKWTRASDFPIVSK
jgi:hypothetical protein